MKRVFAAEIRPGDEVEDVFLVVEARLAPFRDERKGHYLHLVLVDRTGHVEARLWDHAAEAAQWLAPGEVVRVQGRAVLYRERLRLRLDQLEPAGTDRLDRGDLIPPPVLAPDEALVVIHGAVDKIAHPALRSLLEGFYGDAQFVNALAQTPAHRPGELLSRLVQLLELAAPLGYMATALNTDLLVTGILLHEAGLTLSVDGPPGMQAMSLLGVPAVSDQLLQERLAHQTDLSPDLILALRHMILSADDAGVARSREALVLARLRQLHQALVG